MSLILFGRKDGRFATYRSARPGVGHCDPHLLAGCAFEVPQFPSTIGAGNRRSEGAIAGAVVYRLGPNGMSRTLVGMAVVQVLVAAIAVTAGLGDTSSRWPRDVLGATAIFTMIWLVSAGLFRQEARTSADRRRI